MKHDDPYDLVEDMEEILKEQRAAENRQFIKNSEEPLHKNKRGNPLAIGCSGGGGHIAAINAILASFDPTCLTSYSPTPYKDKPSSVIGVSIYMASHINFFPSVKTATKASGLPVLPVHNDLADAIKELENANKSRRFYVDMLLDVYPTGYENAAIWNIQQRQDNKSELAKLINLQSHNDRIFFTEVSDYFLNLLSTASTNGNPYTEVISTQAIGLSALCDAVKTYNLQHDTPIIINQYMTDLPTPGAVHFFNVLSKLSPDHQQQMNVHAVGLNQSVVDHFFVNGSYFKGLYNINPKHNPMIRPGFSRENDNSDKFDKPVELRYLMIPAGEKIASIMLGSQASTDTEIYIDILNDHGMDKIFVFCGSNTALREKLTQKYNSLRQIILLGNQDDAFIASVMTRSNILITRAGGLSVMEQMAMEHNHEQMIMIHHADSNAYHEDKPVLIHHSAESEILSEPELLLSGISWEDHNADLLIQTLNVRVVKTCPSDARQQLMDADPFGLKRSGL